MTKKILDVALKSIENHSTGLFSIDMPLGLSVVTALNTKRVCVGSEIDKKYFKIAVDQMSNERNTK